MMIQNLLVAAPGMMAPHKRAGNTELKVDRYFTSYQAKKTRKTNYINFVVISASMVVLVLTYIVVSMNFLFFPSAFEL